MKTVLLKSNLLIKPSIVLAAAVLTAASFLAPATATAADPMMPTGRGGGHTDDGIQPYDPNPAAPDSMTRQFLTYGFDSDGTSIPLKTLRITRQQRGHRVSDHAGSELECPRETPGLRGLV